MKYSPEDFASDTPPPRIIGTEVEYDVQGTSELTYLLKNQLRAKIDGSAVASSFTKNGSRVHQDIGNLEYAAPEGLGPFEGAATDFAGMYLLEELLAHQPELNYPVYRRSGNGSYGIDDSGEMPKPADSVTTKGFHENFMTIDSLDAKRRNMIASFLASRVVWSGNGLVDITGFKLSQKAGGLEWTNMPNPFNRRTYDGEKPLCIWRNDSDSANPSGGFQRLEVRSGDPNMSPRARWLGLAGVSLALRLAESPKITDEDIDRLNLKNPYHDIHNISNDLSLKRLYTLTSGERVSAADLQLRFAEYARALADTTQLPEDELGAIDEIMALGDQLKVANVKKLELGTLIDAVDWAAKYLLLKKWQFKHNDFSYESAAAFDLHWERIGSSPAKKWWLKRQSDFAARLSDKASELMYDPPEDTRARSRVSLMNHQPGKPVNWDSVGGIALSDPYDAKVYLRIEHNRRLIAGSYSRHQARSLPR